MSIADSVFSAIPGIRRWWWRRKWTSLDVPAAEWAKMDETVEDLADALKSVKSLESLIVETSARAAHGMNTRTSYIDASGKEQTVSIVLDGTEATESLIKGYHKQLDARRREMIDLFVKAGNWAADNAVQPDYPDKAPLHTRLVGFVRNVGRIASELSAAREGRTPDEFLRYALLDKEARAKRLAIETPPERVKLEKPTEPEQEQRPRKRSGSGENDRRKTIAGLLETFNLAGVNATYAGFTQAHAVTRYELRLDKGVKVSKAESAAPEIAMRLGVEKVAVSKSPDKPQIIYVDVPNKDVKPLLYADAPRKDGKFFVGMGIDGGAVSADMESLCHVLIAGTTGSGKSTFLNTLICSMIQAPPSENQFVMIDPKMVELTPYNGIPHLLRPVVTDAAEAVEALEDAAAEMDERYRLFMESSVKKLSEYNAKAAAPLPRLVVVIDELADLIITSGKEVESSIVRIAQKGRAAGVHLLIATQRPTKDVITGQIKANIPSRIAFAVASALESRIILDESGAEKLCGKGDMLYKPVDGKTQRLQGAYIANENITRIVKGAAKS